MRFSIFEKEEIIQGISDVSFGSITRNKRNRAIKFLNSLGHKISVKNLVWAEQVFGAKVHLCKVVDSGSTIKEADGLVSNIKNQVLVIVSADCVPILLFDPKNKVVAALHGSRKSLVKGIIKNAVGKMVSNFACEPKNFLVGIGPHIRKCHYWLREGTYKILRKTKFKKYFIPKKSKTYFDLNKLVFDELSTAGIKRKNIEDCGICTYCCSKKYFSARKKEVSDKIYKEKYSTFASFIGLPKNQQL